MLKEAIIRTVLSIGLAFLTVAFGASQIKAAPLVRAHEVGIDRSALSSQEASVQRKTLHDIHDLGATWFRDGPISGSSQGIVRFVDEARLVQAADLRLLLNIVQMDEDYDAPLPTNDHGWKAKKLSQINLAKFKNRFGALLKAMKDAHLNIDAVEFGNEDDSYYYDADVPYDHRATAAELQTWAIGYGKFLRAGAELLHEARFYPFAKIVTFGIAHGCDQCAGPPRHLSDPARAVAMLKDLDGFDYLDNASYHVDGYGTHVYASPNAVPASVTHTLQEDAAALGTTKPFWITEWGFLDIKAFPNRQHQSLPECLHEFLDTIDELRAGMPIGLLMFYRYDGWLVDTAGKLLPQAKVISAYSAKH